MSLLDKKISTWFMRQAGRYLPEYLEISKKMTFFQMCESPEVALEITLQPIKRFDLDAAVIFSDILVLPRALGCNIDIKKDVGPIIERISNPNELVYDVFEEKISPTLDAIALTRKHLPQNKSLIGFAGGPWTIALYIIEGGWDKTFLRTKKFINKRHDEFKEIISILTDATIQYLKKQVKHGADFIQVFESFAWAASSNEFKEFIIEPTRRIVSSLDVPVIGFPKGAGVSYFQYVKETSVDVISTDHSLPLDWIVDNLQTHAFIQGNLDPYLLAFNKEEALLQTERIIDAFSGKNFIFNLGHGIYKETPLSSVEAVLDFIRSRN
ncbi:uroporphyrinogen decarboxylase [Neorickettsia findlayensis]|uniref:Uroporphyrinogen decarboxylase n=1 Tax=Neorickettsia findlayensis TaxID=2686014 RepID=A0A6P1GB64_9RICK|nr:uroporphyrinogen decarboxylase [Neorickettsia findlayensis]QHD65540.1 uroporphyrinogen decarboxylase [Neorickettsia findlayensis]